MSLPIFSVFFRFFLVFFPFFSLFSFLFFFRFLPFCSVSFRFLPFFLFHFQKEKTGRHCSRDPYCSPCRKRSAAKGVRSLFFVFGTLSVTFRSLFLMLLSRFSSLFCQTPFAGLLLRQGELRNPEIGDLAHLRFVCTLLRIAAIAMLRFGHLSFSHMSGSCEGMSSGRCAQTIQSSVSFSTMLRA